MRTVRLKDLGVTAAVYIDAAEAGETIAVTSGDRIVAEIGPPRSPPKLSDEAFIDMAVREGWMTRAAVHWSEPLPERGPASPDDPDIPFDVLMAELARDREDR